MADITKCPGVDCKVKEQCYRYTAVVGEWQSRFVKQPGNDENCPYFWPDSENQEKKSHKTAQYDQK